MLSTMSKIISKITYRYIILFIICACFFGCEAPKKKTSSGNEEKDTQTTSNPIIQKKIRGMFEYNNTNGIITDCETGSFYNVAEEGEVRSIDSVYNSLDKKDPKRKLYVIVEGFNSFRENPKSSNFDTVIVITRLLGIDTAFNCQK